MFDQQMEIEGRIEGLETLSLLVHLNAQEKGFHGKPLDKWFSDHIANTHAELSELWEAVRAGEEHDPCDKAEKMKELGLTPLSKEEEEYADLVIRALDGAKRRKINIVRAVAAKHLYNTTRPHMHGKKN